MDTHGDDREPGRFYLPGTADAPDWTLRRLDTGRYQLLAPVEYLECEGWSHVVHAHADGRDTDFASVPWFLTWLVPKDGRHTPAAILHDACIGGAEGVDYTTTRPGGIDDQHADFLFREAMQHAHVGVLRRWMMWTAVSLRTMWCGPDGQPRRVVVAALAAIAAVWSVVAALVALDVPDFEQGGWHLPWFGSRPAVEEMWHGLVVIAAGSAVCALLIGLVLRRRRAFGVGAIAGLIVGFLGLPIVASAVGGTGYLVVDNVVTWLTERRLVRPVTLPEEPAAGAAGAPADRARRLGS